MWVWVGRGLVAIGVAIAGGKIFDSKKNPGTWSNIHWPKK